MEHIKQVAQVGAKAVFEVAKNSLLCKNVIMFNGVKLVVSVRDCAPKYVIKLTVQEMIVEKRVDDTISDEVANRFSYLFSHYVQSAL